MTNTTKREMFYEGFVIKNERGFYYCENSNSDWWFDECIRFSCIYETIKEAQESIDVLTSIQVPDEMHIQRVMFEVLEQS